MVGDSTGKKFLPFLSTTLTDANGRALDISPESYPTIPSAILPTYPAYPFNLHPNMLLTITTTHQPATDLGFLLRKNPARAHSRPLAQGTAHVFFPEATDARCTAALYVDIDPVGLVRGRKGPAGEGGLLEQYVNDRPYATSSLLSVAMNEMFRDALNGNSPDRPALVTTPMPLEFHLPVLRSQGGESLLRALFEPLGYAVEAHVLPLDARFPAWGDSSYFALTLRITATLQEALSHLYVLIPVLDNGKHYWVGADEVQKLLKRGERWLSAHPARELIVRRYLCAKRSLVDEAIARLAEYTDAMNEEDTTDAECDATLPGTTAPLSAGAAEQALEAPLSLNTQRLDTVSAAVQALGAASVIDLGCGEGKLLRRLLDLRELTRIVGVDVAHRSLEIATERLHLERLPQRLAEKITLLHGSLTYRDARFEGFDVATVVEVIEHLDPPRLAAFERVLFEYAAPRAIVLTTPNHEYNTLFAGMEAGRLRHTDHRFEWTRAEFAAWASSVTARFGYAMEISGIGNTDATHGAPTQMAVFTRQTATGTPTETATPAQTQASAA